MAGAQRGPADMVSRPLRVLIIEDSEDDALLLVRKLGHEGGYNPSYTRADTLEGFKKALTEPEWDIIISDHSMPHFSALHALQTLRESQLDIPLVIVSGTIEPEAAVAAMKAGASDYIMKDDLTRLVPAIERELREARSRREKRLAEDRFLQAQKIESIGRLAGGIAHDFNNILTAILGYANLLAEAADKSRAWRDDVEEIRRAAERAAGLTRQLLAFSRRQALQLRVVDLNAEFTDLEKMLRRTLGEDIEWAVSLASGLKHVKADPGQIQQVVMNLVVNARDAMPHGGKLTVETENVDLLEPRVETDFIIPPGAYVALTVGDTGAGITGEVRSHLFEPYFTTKEKGKGSGLGLAVIYGIVKQSGGYIAVNSVPGKGAAFKIYFPKAEGTAGAKAAEPAARESQQASETVLFVDDDQTVRTLVRRVLRQHGYTILEAGRGDEALDLARRHTATVHLLLTDMVLPDINGLELARRISSLHPEAKLLLISGYLDRDFGDFSLDEKIPFLPKPFTPAALEKMVREVLDRQEVPGDAARPAPPEAGTR